MNRDTLGYVSICPGFEGKISFVIQRKVAKEAGAYGSIINKEFQYVYLLEFSGDEKDLVLQEEEAQEVRFVHTERIEKEMNAFPEKYVPHGKYWVEIIEEVRRRLKN